ncbi:Golgi transport complex subunit 3, partial [Physocladia obscura]
MGVGKNWEAVTKLDDAQVQTVALLSQYAHTHSSLSASLQSVQANSASKAAAVAVRDTAAGAAGRGGDEAGGADRAIDTAQAFLAWFAVVERDLAQQQELGVRRHVAHVEAAAAHVAALASRVQLVARLVAQQHAHFGAVGAKTRTLQRECETLLADVGALEALFADVDARLLRLDVLGPAMQLLNAPYAAVLPLNAASNATSPVLHPDFAPTLARLDAGLDFVASHPAYRDAALYQAKFRQCVTRALSLVKMHLVQAFASANQNASSLSSLAASPNAATDPNAPANQQTTFVSLASSRLRSLAPALRPLIDEIDVRIDNHHEYYGLLAEVLSAYFSVRSALIAPIVSKRINSFLSNNDSNNNNTADVLSVVGLPELTAYLDSLAVTLYDHLRPRIVREHRIDVLAELCRNLFLHLESVDGLERGVAFPVSGDSSGGSGGSGGSGVGELLENAAPVKYVVGKILQDTQERLAFRA